MQDQEKSSEEIIELLTTISEVTWEGGLLLLDMMHRGYLDNLLSENDEEFNKKIEILKRHTDLLTSDLFGDLTFIVITQTIEKNIERLIGLLSSNENDYIVDLFKEAFIMYSNHYRPWEVKFSLEKKIGHDVSIEKIFLTYLRKGERYTDCLNRYLKEGH